MDGLTLFGLLAVTAMVVCYALEPRSRWFVLGFAGACVLGSVCGFLQGARPFGVVEAVWALVAARTGWRWEPQDCPFEERVRDRESERVMGARRGRQTMLSQTTR